MQLAVISDIHGNCLALEAVLEDLRLHGFSGSFVCLGDAIQGGPQPAEAAALLRSLDCPVVMGNADDWLLHGEKTSSVESVTEVQERVRAWSLSRLSENDTAFIESFQPTVRVPLEGGVSLLCFHGSPASFDELIFPETPDDDFQRMLGESTGSIMCGGHTHLQQIRHIGSFFFFNPGSVGLVYNRNQREDDFHLDPWAEYAVLSSEGKRISLDLRRVPYDIDELIRIYEASGRPNIEALLAQYGRG